MNLKRLSNRNGLSRKVSDTSRRQKAVTMFKGGNGRVKTFAIISVENPMAMKFSREENNKRDESFKKELRSGNYTYNIQKGMYGQKENSFMIFNIPLNSAYTISQKYAQESFFYCEFDDKGLRFDYYSCAYNGSKERYLKTMDYHSIKYDFIESSYAFSDKEDEYYTAIGRKFKFSIQMKEFGNVADALTSSINDTALERGYTNEVVESYILDCVSDSVASYSQWKMRGHLGMGQNSVDKYIKC